MKQLLTIIVLALTLSSCGLRFHIERKRPYKIGYVYNIQDVADINRWAKQIEDKAITPAEFVALMGALNATKEVHIVKYKN